MYSVMKLRDHPLVCHKNLPGQPPTWICPENRNRTTAVDEDGILTRTTFHALGDDKIALRMHTEGGEYLAHVYFNDQAFCLLVYKRLQDYIGRPLKDAGDMEFEPEEKP